MLLQTYFWASEGGKIGPYAHNPFNFLNLTEIFYNGKIIKSRKQELSLAVRKVYMPKNRYAINYAILAYRTGFKIFVNLSLCDEWFCIELFFSVTHKRS